MPSGAPAQPDDGAVPSGTPAQPDDGAVLRDVPQTSKEEFVFVDGMFHRVIDISYVLNESENKCTPSFSSALNDISPLPKARMAQRARKRRKNVNVYVITADNDEAKFRSVADDEKTLTNDLPSKKPKKKCFLKRKNVEEPKYFCIFCDEQYRSPPTEDWIECNLCRKWCHESCSDFAATCVDTKYICDYCR